MHQAILNDDQHFQHLLSFDNSLYRHIPSSHSMSLQWTGLWVVVPCPSFESFLPCTDDTGLKLESIVWCCIMECFKTLSFFVSTAHNHELIEISSFDVGFYLYCQLELVSINMPIPTLTYPLTNISSNYLFLLLPFPCSCSLILFHFHLHPCILIYSIFVTIFLILLCLPMTFHYF